MEQDENEVTWSLQIDQDWVVDRNAPTLYLVGFDATLLFCAFNARIGKEVSIYYNDNDETKFTLTVSTHKRQGGYWALGEDSAYKDFKSHNVNELKDELQKHLNPYCKDLVPMIFLGGWNILYNNILNEFYSEEATLIFFAIKQKYFIDVIYCNEKDCSYIINTGKVKYKMTPGIYQIEPKSVLFSSEYKFKNKEDVIKFIEHFLENHNEDLNKFF